MISDRVIFIGLVRIRRTKIHLTELYSIFMVVLLSRLEFDGWVMAFKFYLC